VNPVSFSLPDSSLQSCLARFPLPTYLLPPAKSREWWLAAKAYPSVRQVASLQATDARLASVRATDAVSPPLRLLAICGKAMHALSPRERVLFVWWTCICGGRGKARLHTLGSGLPTPTLIYSHGQSWPQLTAESSKSSPLSAAECIRWCLTPDGGGDSMRRDASAWGAVS
jgi:hypothetical protein